MKLFCIPYAGGMANIYYSWVNKIDNVEVIPIELKGRGKRFGESFYKGIDDGIDDISKYIKSKIGYNEEFSIFGHSMGALYAFELYYKLMEMDLRPRDIFVSGRRPPQLMNENKAIHNLCPIEFKKELLSIGGTPKEFFDNIELLEIFEPILRADFKAIYEYKYREKDQKISSNVIVLSGREDIPVIKDIDKWNDLTKNNCKMYFFDGGHFFINEHKDEVIELIKNQLDFQTK